MDPVPPAPVQPAFQPEPITSPNPPTKIWVWIMGGILLLGVGIVTGILLGKQIYSQPSMAPSPLPISQPTPTPDLTANWKTYTDSKLNYSFQYPPTTCELQRSIGDTSFAICYLPKGGDGGPKNNNGYVITLGFISQSQLNVMGITYCGAYPNDFSRCESFKIGKFTASIDWGTDSEARASALISHPKGGIVTFNLQPVTSESKEMLKQILSTFKFIDSDSNQVYTCPVGGWVNCMPILNEAGKKGCSPEGLDWYKNNCPNFQGVAY